jgi:branched-chain amino acid transport system substrate-binding protein
MARLKGLFVLCLSCSCLCLFACGEDAPESTVPESVKVGAIYPFTGHSASTGEDIRAGVELAVELINHSYALPIPGARKEGIVSMGGAPIEILFRDSGSDETTVRQLVDQLADEDVVALLGCYNSVVTAAASEEAEILGIPFVNPDSTSPVLTKRDFKWFFRTTPDDAMFAENFFTFLSEVSKDKDLLVPKALTLVYENQLWGTGVARAERKYAARFGYDIVADIPYDADAETFSHELNRVRSAMPSVILQSSYDSDAIAFMKGYKALEIFPVAVLAMDAGFISPSFLQSLGKDAEYVLSREVWALDMGERKPLVGKINDLFRQRFGADMTGNSARAFTGVLVLADALNRAADLSSLRVREALLKTEIAGDLLIMPWDGVRFDPETGQNTLGKGLIVQMQEGRYVTVWPSSVATHDLVWPMPAWSERTVKE